MTPNERLSAELAELNAWQSAMVTAVTDTTDAEEES